jgi:hypothetical protein
MTLLDQTSLSKRTKTNQKSHEMLLREREMKRFLCIVTRPHERELKVEKMMRERRRHESEVERPTRERMFIMLRKLRTS